MVDHGSSDPRKRCDNKKGRPKAALIVVLGRGDRIRTCDFYVPNVALYQAELHPVGSRVS